VHDFAPGADQGRIEDRWRQWLESVYA
jgi:hypothetical protein